MLLPKLGGFWLLPPRDFPHHYESHPMDHDSDSSGHTESEARPRAHRMVSDRLAKERISEVQDSDRPAIRESSWSVKAARFLSSTRVSASSIGLSSSRTRFSMRLIWSGSPSTTRAVIVLCPSCLHAVSRRKPAKVVNLPSCSGLTRIGFNRPYFWMESANSRSPVSFEVFRGSAGLGWMKSRSMKAILGVTERDSFVSEAVLIFNFAFLLFTCLRNP